MSWPRASQRRSGPYPETGGTSRTGDVGVVERMKSFRKKRKRRRWKAIRQRTKAFFAAVWAWIVKTYQRLSGELRRRAVVANMLQADIILASPRTVRLSPIALTYRLLLKARYVHSMLYLGGGKILHTTARHGVEVAPVPRGIFKKDRYTILRAPQLRAEERQRVVREALKMTDKKLDRAGLVTNIPAKLFGFRKPLLRMEKNRLWCSKLIHRAYSSSGIDLVPADVTENITSEDLHRSPLLKKV